MTATIHDLRPAKGRHRRVSDTPPPVFPGSDPAADPYPGLTDSQVLHLWAMRPGREASRASYPAGVT